MLDLHICNIYKSIKIDHHLFSPFQISIMRFLITVLMTLMVKVGFAQVTIVSAKAYLDVRQGKLIEPAVLVIDNGKITAINPSSIPANAKKIDLPGKIILPGMIDAHVHLDMNLETGYATNGVKENASLSVLRAYRNAHTTLLAGFTTVRSMGQTLAGRDLTDVSLAEASERGWIDAPRIIPAGHMISITGGHGDPAMMGGLKDGIVEISPEVGVADGIDEVTKAVRYQIKYGAKVIKFMATAGVTSLESSAGAQQYSEEEMKAIVTEARRHDIKVAAHGHGTEGINSAINAGVSSIEHGSILDDKTIALMKEKGVFLVPTTALLDIIAQSYDKLDPRIVEKAKRITILARESHTKAFNAGVKVALGTDAPLVPHGQNAIELSAMVRRGMPVAEAIKCATILAAELIGVNDRGEIKTGLLADIIAVDSNPLEKISVLENVVFVMKGGKIVKQ